MLGLALYRARALAMFALGLKGSHGKKETITLRPALLQFFWKTVHRVKF
jgi:hypothetical protein